MCRGDNSSDSDSDPSPSPPPAKRVRGISANASAASSSVVSSAISAATSASSIASVHFPPAAAAVLSWHSSQESAVNDEGKENQSVDEYDDNDSNSEWELDDTSAARKRGDADSDDESEVDLTMMEEAAAGSEDEAAVDSSHSSSSLVSSLSQASRRREALIHPQRHLRPVGLDAEDPSIFPKEYACCSQRCWSKRGYDRDFVERVRLKLREMTPSNKKAHILSNVVRVDVSNGSELKKVNYLLPTINRIDFTVCQRFFIDVFEINSNYCANASIRSVQSLGRVKFSPKGEDVRHWLKDQEKFHEYMPDTVGAGRAKPGIMRKNGVQLPYANKHEVFLEYKKDMESRAAQPVPMGEAPPLKACKVAYFRKIWRKDYRNLHLRKHLRFSKCDTCVDLRAKFGTISNHDPVLHQQTRDEFRKHIDMVKAERTYYHQKRRDAARGADALSIIFDGADQGSYGFPYFQEKTKTTDGCWKQKYHLIGVIVHGVGSWVYTMSDKWCSDSNVTIEVLQRILTIIEQQKGTLPSVLCLQMDNCVRENKNKYVLAYLSWLVQRQVFKEVQLSFLPVGHTHEDIDQLFSRLAVYLRGHDAIDRTMLYAGIQKAFHQYGLAPVCNHLDTVADLRSFFKPHLQQIGGHTEREILHYTIRSHANGASMLTKAKAIDAWDIYGDYASGDYGFHLIKTTLPHPPFAANNRPAACAPKPPSFSSTGSNRMQDETAKEIEKGLRTLEKDWRVSRAQLQSLREDLQDFENRDPVPFNWPNDGQFACERVRMERIHVPPAIAVPLVRWSIPVAAAAQALVSDKMLERDRANLMDGQMLQMISSTASRAAAAAMTIPTFAGAAAAVQGNLKRGTLRDSADISKRNHDLSYANQVPKLFPIVLQKGCFIVLRPSGTAASSAASPSAAAASSSSAKSASSKKSKKADTSASGERDFWLGKVLKYRREDGHILYQDYTPYLSKEGHRRNVKTCDAYEGNYTGDVEHGQRVTNWHHWEQDDMWTFFTAEGMTEAGNLTGHVRTYLKEIIQRPPPIRSPLDPALVLEEPGSPWAEEDQPADYELDGVSHTHTKGGKAAAATAAALKKTHSKKKKQSAPASDS